jgi:serine/threonine-protein kinase
VKYATAVPLGQGAMGEVYKAWDPGLQRFVALKFLHRDDPALAERLLREARLQARVDHESVCKVYEVGIDEGRPFIAMQCIEGRTLDAARSTLRLEEKVAVMRQVAEAVHAAHRTGLIHRDIKPGNIMLEEREGGLHPYVLDFGLAREEDKGGLTHTGAVLGTPAYMAPEQARGEVKTLDRRTDVYGLGAVLHELLAGRPPFEGQGAVDVLMKVLHHEPVPLRRLDRQLPADLERVVLKCLEKEPQRRYDSARELADDLGRFLDGEPVQARASGHAHRLLRRARRHRAAVAVSLAAAAAVLALLTLWLRARWSAAEEAQLAQVFGQEVERVEAVLRQSHMLPLHDTRPQRALVRQKMRWIEEQMGKRGDLGAGPGHYALGKGYLALSEYEAAERHLSQAWTRHGYTQPEVAYALGLALAMRYRDELAEADRITGKEMQQARRRAIDARFREPALAYLTLGRQAPTEAVEYVEALLAYLGRDHARALQQARHAAEKLPWQYEADTLAGDIHKAMGDEKRVVGALAEARALYEQARLSYVRATEKAKSDGAAYEGLCSLGVAVMLMQSSQTGESPEASYRAAIAACQSAREANPDRARTHALEAMVHLRWGQHLSQTGSDGAAPIDLAVAAGRRAVAASPQDPGAQGALAYALAWRGFNDSMLGRDASESLRDSLAVFGTAAARAPNDVVLLNNYGTTWIDAHTYASEHGQDPRPPLQNAIDVFERAIGLEPRLTSLHGNLGTAYYQKSLYEHAHGTDGGPSLEKAVRSLQLAIEINPGLVSLHNNLAAAHVHQADMDLDRGRDPRPALEKARASLTRALSINPQWISSIFLLGRASAIEAHYLLLTDGDPLPAAREAAARLSQSLGSEPSQADVQEALADAHRVAAEHALRRRRSPQAALQKARAASRTATTADASYAGGWTQRGANELLAGRWERQNGRPGRRSWQAAWDAFSHAARLKASAPAHFGLARVCREEAQERLASGRLKEAAARVEQGLEQVAAGLAIDGGRAEGLALKGALLLLRARSAAATGARRQAAGEAAAALAQALQANRLLEREYRPLKAQADEMAGGARPPDD